MYFTFLDYDLQAVQRQRLPGYWLELVKNAEGEEVLTFLEKNQLPTDHPGFEFRRLPRPPMGFPAD